MKKIISALLLLTTFGLQAQDKANFEEYVNPFWDKIRTESDKYAKNKKAEAPKKSFKMNFEGINIPQSLDEFTIVKVEDPISQGNTGTCWCFSTTSFYESEIERIQEKTIDLSELYLVYYEYVEKARGFINTRGKTYLGEGSETNALQRMMTMYGTVPFSAYEGKPQDQPFYNHVPMFNEFKTYLNTCKKTNYWDETAILNNIKSILNHHMGEPPTSFDYEGKSYTPKTFLSEVVKLNPNDYVDVMSLMEKIPQCTFR